ncbi:MAG: ribbon-helix-helix protein, CopG family [Abditibacteriales bacterium]|nr:ribbon-helix-helix protein, CopG family [Abditibacteriales bacterium]MDW8365806.1 ribbon-helix-helix protein, CopG family [Abditibacteriales bacterium]
MSVTLQIELPEKDAALLLNEASRQGISVSEFLRRLLRRNRIQPAALSDEEYANDPLWSIVGIAQTGTTDGSTQHDKYIYDEER